MLSLDDVAGGLPHSLHDATLRKLEIDYVAHEARLTVEVCVGDPEAKTEAEREARRMVTVVVSGLGWCVIEPPRSNEGHPDEGIWIDAGLLGDRPGPRPAVPAIPPNAFAWWIFVHDWNAFLFLAGTRATIL